MPHTVKPVVLFVHGSWHSPAHFKPVTDLFQSKGYRTVCPCLPTFNPPKPTVALPDDAACIGSELKKLIEDEQEDVIVAMHSYGGVVGTEAVKAEWGKQPRQLKAQRGGVLRLLYLCAFVLPPNASLASALGYIGGEIPPYIAVQVSPRETRQHTLRNYNALHCVLIKWLTPRVWLAIVQHVPQLWWLFCRVVTVKASQNVNFMLTAMTHDS